MSPFKIVYGVDPLSPLNLMPKAMDERPSAEASKRGEEIRKLHELVKSKIEKSNVSYQAQANKHKKRVVLQPGDLVWIHLRKEQFSSKHKNKLMQKADSPFEILERRTTIHTTSFAQGLWCFGHIECGGSKSILGG